MGLISKEVEVTLGNMNIKHYEDLGYQIPRYKDSRYNMSVKRGTKIIVKAKDVHDKSKIYVDVECDGCGKTFSITFAAYKQNVKEDDKYYCHSCAMKFYGTENCRISKLKNGKSFYDWCYENLLQEKADEVMAKWDYELNVDIYGNKLTPKDVSYASSGINKKGYWFKCLNHCEHKSEQKDISHFSLGRPINLVCNQCNTIALTHPELVKYYINIEDTNKYSANSKVMIDMRCPNCGYIKKGDPCHLTTQGFSCPKCSDGRSYPEKIMFNILEQLEVDFDIQLGKTKIDWCDKYKYDFYIPSLNCIIETHGNQHYERGFEEIKSNTKIRTLQEEKDNDKVKEELALKNKIKNYIIIDCRKSELEFIKNNILNSKLAELYNLCNINWLKCHEHACNSLVKKACDLWSEGIKNVSIISDKLKLDKSTIQRYLKQGAKLGWCDYDSVKEIDSMRKRKYKKVICLTTNEIFDSVKDSSLRYTTSSFSNIATCCRGKAKSAGKHPETGEKLVWMYYEDYIKQEEKNSDKSKVI